MILFLRLKFGLQNSEAVYNLMSNKMLANNSQLFEVLIIVKTSGGDKGF